MLAAEDDRELAPVEPLGGVVANRIQLLEQGARLGAPGLGSVDAQAARQIIG